MLRLCFGELGVKTRYRLNLRLSVGVGRCERALRAFLLFPLRLLLRRRMVSSLLFGLAGIDLESYGCAFPLRAE
jgi:hypothetical protein